MEKRILVLGGTGKMGVPVAEDLKKHGFQVRVMTRNEEKAKRLFDESFEMIVGDVRKSDDLEIALHGCFGVHISISPLEIEPLVAKSVATLALKKGLHRITYVSGTNNLEKNSWNFICRTKLAAGREIRESGISYTIFCPTGGLENLPLYVQKHRASVFGKQPYPLHWYPAEDYGRMVATSYQKEEAADKKLFIHGPEPILTHEAVRRYYAVFHPEIKKISTIPYWMAKIITWIIRNEEMKVAIAVTSFYEKAGGEGRDLTEANHILGAPTITFNEWMQKRKARLNSDVG